MYYIICNYYATMCIMKIIYNILFRPFPFFIYLALTMFIFYKN